MLTPTGAEIRGLNSTPACCELGRALLVVSFAVLSLLTLQCGGEAACSGKCDGEGDANAGAELDRVAPEAAVDADNEAPRDAAFSEQGDAHAQRANTESSAQPDARALDSASGVSQEPPDVSGPFSRDADDDADTPDQVAATDRSVNGALTDRSENADGFACDAACPICDLSGPWTWLEVRIGNFGTYLRSFAITQTGSALDVTGGNFGRRDPAHLAGASFEWWNWSDVNDYTATSYGGTVAQGCSQMVGRVTEFECRAGYWFAYRADEVCDGGPCAAACDWRGRWSVVADSAGAASADGGPDSGRDEPVVIDLTGQDGFNISGTVTDTGGVRNLGGRVEGRHVLMTNYFSECFYFAPSRGYAGTIDSDCGHASGQFMESRSALGGTWRATRL